MRITGGVHPRARLRVLVGSRGKVPGGGPGGEALGETRGFSYLQGPGNPNLVNKTSLKFCKNVAFLWQFYITLQTDFVKCSLIFHHALQLML